jgi:hypothetical protein
MAAVNGRGQDFHIALLSLQAIRPTADGLRRSLWDTRLFLPI